jgi:isopentenyl-diphosphate delta-isomerase
MEHVILLDENGNAVGTADKATVHHADTPLHLAFSSYVFDAAGRLLLSQRAWSKKTWPGIWTNSCCGHPALGEAVADSVRRRLRDELGLQVADVDLVLPRFRYRAVMPDGIVENEMCPVFRVFTDARPRPNPAEVADVRWVPWSDVVADDDVRSTLSPWCQLQLAELDRLGPEPAAWPTGDATDLPPAARQVTEPTR